MMYEDYDPERDRQDVGHLIVGFIIGLWALFLMTMCTGCTTTKYVTIPEYHTDTLIQTKIVKDSVYLKDSTHVSEKNDTVKIEHWHTEFLKKEVPAKLTWWQQTRLHLANILLMALALCAVVWIGKNHIKRLMP